MRTLSVMFLVAAALVGSVTAKAADPFVVSAVASEVLDSNQGAVWERRTLLKFTHPLTINSETQGWREVSCDQIYNSVRDLLLQLGARASDMTVDERACYAYSRVRSIDVRFSVLAPSGSTRGNIAGPAAEARWETVAMKGNCPYLQYITKTVLPLFSTRNVKLISTADCARFGVGLYAQVLKAPGQPVVSP